MNRTQRLKKIEEALDNIPDAEMLIGEEEDATEFRIRELYTAVRSLADDMKEEIELLDRR